MPFALLLIGIILITVAVRGTQDTFVKLLKNDFTGKGNFWYWVIAILLLGGIGYFPKLKPVSDGLLVLILLALLLTRGSPSFPGGGFFKQFTQAIGTTTGGSAAFTIKLPTLQKG